MNELGGQIIFETVNIIQRHPNEALTLSLLGLGGIGLTKIGKKVAEMFGGADDDYEEYDNKQPDNRHYSDKGGHKERSKHHAPQHNEHWKKQGED
jgi:hypothetical protein